MEAFKRPYTFDRVVRLVIGVLVAVALFLMINKLLKTETLTKTIPTPFVISNIKNCPRTHEQMFPFHDNINIFG